MEVKLCKKIKIIKYSLLFICLLLVILTCVDTFSLASSINLISSSNIEISSYEEVTYTEMDFSNFKKVIDYNGNGISDNLEFVIGAREFVETKPKYVSEYYDGGYPPYGVGVCTDVIASAFLKAGYDLRELVDSDIRLNQSAYNLDHIDKNIDYRRVSVLDVFFSRNAYTLTNDLTKKEEWQPGDIVLFPHHIGILSDKLNENGYPYVIHHGGGDIYEEDALEEAFIVSHYRWN